MMQRVRPLRALRGQPRFYAPWKTASLGHNKGTTWFLEGRVSGDTNSPTGGKSALKTSKHFTLLTPTSPKKLRRRSSFRVSTVDKTCRSETFCSNIKKIVITSTQCAYAQDASELEFLRFESVSQTESKGFLCQQDHMATRYVS